MVEIKSEENNTVQLPNNIRQVGTPGEKIKIYIEDYVMTYLNQMTGEKPALQKAALLLGQKGEYGYLLYQCGSCCSADGVERGSVQIIVG